MSVEVAAAASASRRRGRWQARREACKHAGMAGLVEAADKSVTCVRSSGTVWPVPDSRDRGRGRNRTTTAPLDEKPPAVNTFGPAVWSVQRVVQPVCLSEPDSGLASPYCCMVLS